MSQTSKQRVKSLMGRLLSSVEHLLAADLDEIEAEEEFKLKGSDILLLRNIILDACNDTMRSMPGKESDTGFSFPRDSFPIYKHAILDIDNGGEEGEIPAITMRGEPRFIYEIRDKIGCGVVYNEFGKCFYTCVGLDNIIDRVIPFLDQARLARIVIADGEYQEWRRSVVDIYRRTGEEDEANS